MSEINFQPLFEYLDGRFGEVKADIADVKQDVGGLRISVDNLAKNVKDFGEEFTVQRERIDRVELKIK